MKNKIFLVLAFLFMFAGIPNVYAEEGEINWSETSCVENGNLTTCTVKIQLSSTLSSNLIKVHFSGIDYEGYTNSRATANWRILSESAVVRNNTTDYEAIIGKKDSTSIDAGSYEIVTIIFKKIENPGQNCNLSYSISPANTTSYVCQEDDGDYFDKNGNYLGSGEEARVEYTRQCLHTGTGCVRGCYKDNNGTMYDKNCNIVTDEDAWIKECVPVPPKRYSCLIENEIYYDKNGNSLGSGENAYNAYFKSCMIGKCMKLSDGTMYGKNGDILTDPNEYKKQCPESEAITYKCEIVGDIRYGKDGKVVNELEYQKQCPSACSKLSDGTLFGKNKQIVDQNIYDKECGDKKVCIIKDGKYIGKDGKEVNEITYYQTCDTNICKQVGNVYYGKDGKVLTKDKYLEICKNQVDNPKTGVLVSIVTLVGLGVSGFVAIRYAKKHNRFV